MEEGMSGFCIRSRSCVHGNKSVSVSTTNSNSSNNNSGTKCGRWNPTTEQVKVLTELFRSGLRTPSTDQIQKISSELSFYGKIESKNVFYWFQNHKARERQKRRKLSFHQKCNPCGQVSEADRVIETLQLFPLNSFGEPESQKLRLHAHEYCRDNNHTMFSYSMGEEQMEHPPLDLRLSSL